MGRRMPVQPVVDLFDISINESPGSAWAARMQAIANKQLGQQIWGILQKVLKSKRYPKLDIQLATLVSLLEKNIRLMTTQKKILKTHLAQISDLVKILVKNMPEKQAKRAAVRKFCNKILQIVSSHEMAKTFLKTLDEESQKACEA